MAYSTARAKIVSLVEGVTPTDMRLFPEGFKHVPEGADGKALRSRCFWIESNVDGEGRLEGPYTADISGNPRFRARVTMTFFYRDAPSRRNVLDEAIHADIVALTKTIAKPVNWGAVSTTNIHWLGDPSWRRESIEAGELLRFSFDLVHH